MQKKLTVLFAFAIFVLVVGWAITPAQAHCKKFGGVVDPDCRGSEDPLFEYTAKLTLGAFVFPAVDVTPILRDSELRSESNVFIQRPNDNRVLAETWDNLFDKCPVLLISQVESFDVLLDNLEITMSGGVRVIFHDVLLESGAAEVTVELIGDTFDFSGVPFLPEGDGETSEFILTKGAIFGRSVRGEPGPRRSCQPSGGGGFDIFDLLDATGTSVPSTLVITATAP